MSVTEKLLRVFRVDQQLQGLQSRLRAAERFLDEQTKQVHTLDGKRDTLTAQLKKLQATIADHEGEMARVDARVEALREQMNSARTNKDYKAFLTEINTLKADRSTTETAALEQLDLAVDFADRLTRLGCQFALDDFGTGFGSLPHLRQLPVRFLKIDTSFVRNVSSSREDQAIVRGIVAIARELGVRTVAEGIEDAGTLELVSDYGVDFAQGFHIGRPAPVG